MNIEVVFAIEIPDTDASAALKSHDYYDEMLEEALCQDELLTMLESIAQDQSNYMDYLCTGNDPIDGDAYLEYCLDELVNSIGI